MVSAPTYLGLSPTGVEHLATTLKNQGLVKKLHAREGPTLKPGPYTRVRDIESGYLNPDGIRKFSLSLADVIGNEIDQGHIPIVLGGDCSVLIGSMLGLRRRGRYGLLFMDGHADYYGSHESPTGEVADMDLAIVTGANNNHDLLTNIDGLKPLVQPEDTVLFGFRDEQEAKEYGSQNVRDSDIHSLSLYDIRQIGWESALNQALSVLTKDELKGFFLHFDVDVIDDALMPAVDYRIEG